jgi:hypothetical protein
VQQLGEHLNDIILEQLRGTDLGRPPGPPGDLVRSLADHFWYELLAVLSHAVRQTDLAIRTMTVRSANRICAALVNDGRLAVPEHVIRFATNGVSRYLTGALRNTLPDLHAVALTAQLLALLICKSPERHKSVAEYCLKPLTGWLRRETREQVIEAFKDWMPDLAGEIPPPDRFVKAADLSPP